jgi:phosphatidylinositol alpha-1,6-mannosyltransferase
VNRDEAAELIAKADIFTVHLNKGVLTNREEAFGVVFIEAMAAGLPIVAGNSGAITETVIDGKTGILFEPEDVSGQAAALFKLGTDLDMRNRMGKEAWLLAKERFSMDQEKTKLRRILNLR